MSLAWGQGYGLAQADTQALPDQQRSCPCLFCVISWFPSSTSLICLFEPWRRQAFASLAGPEQSRRLRVGLPILDNPQRMSRSFVDVFVSEQGQQSSSSGLTLPQQHQQTGTQMQSAFPPLDQLQGGLGQYQPAGDDQTHTPTGAPVDTATAHGVLHRVYLLQ